MSDDDVPSLGVDLNSLNLKDEPDIEVRVFRVNKLDLRYALQTMVTAAHRLRPDVLKNEQSRG